MFFIKNMILEILAYTFTIPSNHKDYIRVGAIGWVNNPTTNLTLYDESNVIKYSNKSKEFEDYINIKNYESAYINVIFNCTSPEFICKNFIYLMQSDYKDMISVNKDKDYSLPIIGGLDILLDLSSIKSNKKIIFEYNKEWYSEFDSFSAYGFNTNNEYDIKNNGISLDIIDKNCKNNICKGSITKSSSDLKTIILKIPKDTKKHKYIDFRYEVHNSTPNHPYFSCLLGLLLSMPNIIWFIARRIKKKWQQLMVLYL